MSDTLTNNMKKNDISSRDLFIRPRNALRQCGYGLLFVLPIISTVACTRSRKATREDCEKIVESIIDLELTEIGYRDPTLNQLKKEAFKKTYAKNIAECTGKRLNLGAMHCIRSAKSAEAISHECLQ